MATEYKALWRNVEGVSEVSVNWQEMHPECQEKHQRDGLVGQVPEAEPGKEAILEKCFHGVRS